MNSFVVPSQFALYCLHLYCTACYIWLKVSPLVEKNPEFTVLYIKRFWLYQMTCSNKLFRYNSLQNLMFDNNTLVCINLDTALSLYSQCVSLRYNLFQNSIFYNNTFVFINPDTTLSVFSVCIVKIQLVLELNILQ